MIQVTIGFTSGARNEGEATAQAEALVESMREDYGLLDVFVESVTDSEALEDDNEDELDDFDDEDDADDDEVVS